MSPTPASREARPLRLGPLVRGPVLVGLAAIALGLGGFGAWAGLAQLSSAAVATGVVSPDGSRRTVQHLEGGIIHDILVADGDAVASGQPLVILDDLAARAQRNIRHRRVHALKAQETRLAAEAADELTFAGGLTDRAAGEPEIARAIADEREIFDLHNETARTRADILRSRIAQLEQQIDGLEAEIESLETQAGLIGREVGTVQGLLERGLEREPRLLALQRTEAEIEGAVGRAGAEIARLEQEIGETRLHLLDLAAGRRQDAAARLAEVRAELAALEQELVASEDVLTRTVVVAPVGGRVINLRFRTEGGVIGPGEAILEIVPADDEMVIEAQVAPADIDVLRPGLEADIHFTPYSTRQMPRVTGRIVEVSADRLVDERSGEAYYLARIEVDRAALGEIASGVVLTPGMPVDVMIKTGSRTPLAYLLGPIEQSFRHAFREQ